ncbi:pickpocket protein 28-like isoform X2 [Coccinella septempunctata]|uniref:pickpocket protein 28-like isoform X2 n=1 Tax=Coccinella septempunctata TaxID=41139 RepID=UPI001D07CAB1|nr:pickpocket protein 28-like isoform X2 [Coccinella septempunctata]
MGNFCVNSKKYWKNYCQQCSIHGLNYLVNQTASIEKLWWLVIFILCVSGSVIMIFQICDKWSTTPVLVSLATNEKSISEIPFPAVTICPESRISTKCVNYTKILLARQNGDLSNTTFEENKYYDYLALLCRAENHVKNLQLINRTRSELFKEPLPEGEEDMYPSDFRMNDFTDFLMDCASIKLNDSFCQWMGVNQPCEDLMTPILTDEGLCYSFNMFDVREIFSDVNQMKYFGGRSEKKANWDPDWGYPNFVSDDDYPRRTFLNGAKNAFVAVFLTRKDQIDYACRDFSLQGMRVSFNIPTRIPRPSQVFFSVGLNSLTTAAVNPFLTSVRETIKNYEAHERNCFFSNERKLKYFKIYSQGNCNLECLTNYTIHYCGCVHYYMPRDNQTRICSLQERQCLVEARVTYPQAVLSERLWARSEKEPRFRMNCDCLPVCTDLVYEAEITTGEWDFNNPDEAAFDAQKDYIDQ